MSETNEESNKPKTIYYLLESHPDEDVKEYIYWKTTEIILCSQIFFIAYLFLYLFISIEEQSLYYWIFYGPIPVIHMYSSLMVLFRKDSWSTQDIRTVLMFNFSDMLSGLTYQKVNYRAFTTWISCRALLFLYSLLVWQEPLNTYIDKVSPPTNTSSCTTEYLRNTGNSYNPYGFFNYNLNYTDQIQLKFCPMDQTYAYPNQYSYIIGYELSPLGIEGAGACQNPLTPTPDTLYNSLVNGYADTYICKNYLTGKSLSYLSPVLGIDPPITAGSRRSPIKLCKGNLALNICISKDGTQSYEGICPDSFTIGKPKKICPTCLNYFRSISGDITGPAGYEHCSAYDKDAFNNPFCAFCAGRGYGWLHSAKYGESDLLLSLICTSILSGLMLVEYITILVMVIYYIPDISKIDYSGEDDELYNIPDKQKL